jgi:hypothetical protein
MTPHCQVPNLNQIQQGRAAMPKMSYVKKLKFFGRRRLDPGRERRLKNRSNRWLNSMLAVLGLAQKPTLTVDVSTTPLQAKDSVRVRPVAEIKATLNHWKQLKGCTFMPEMEPYCGTIQEVFKRMERFVDERDLCVKKTGGIILLKDLFCEGVADFGRCDRACHYFWREEWLEKIDDGEIG